MNISWDKIIQWLQKISSSAKTYIIVGLVFIIVFGRQYIIDWAIKSNDNAKLYNTLKYVPSKVDSSNAKLKNDLYEKIDNSNRCLSAKIDSGFRRQSEVTKKTFIDFIGLIKNMNYEQKELFKSLLDERYSYIIPLSEPKEPKKFEREVEMFIAKDVDDLNYYSVYGLANMNTGKFNFEDYTGINVDTVKHKKHIFKKIIKKLFGDE